MKTILILLSSLGYPSSKIGDYIDPLICFAGLGINSGCVKPPRM